MRGAALVIAILLGPAASAEAAACKRVTGKIGYYAKDIRTSGGARCAAVRPKIRAWLNGPITKRIAGPRGWSCRRDSSKRRIAYDCDAGRGRVRFIVKFAVG